MYVENIICYHLFLFFIFPTYIDISVRLENNYVAYHKWLRTYYQWAWSDLLGTYLLITGLDHFRSTSRTPPPPRLTWPWTYRAHSSCASSEHNFFPTLWCPRSFLYVFYIQRNIKSNLLQRLMVLILYVFYIQWNLNKIVLHSKYN